MGKKLGEKTIKYATDFVRSIVSEHGLPVASIALHMVGIDRTTLRELVRKGYLVEVNVKVSPTGQIVKAYYLKDEPPANLPL